FEYCCYVRYEGTILRNNPALHIRLFLIKIAVSVSRRNRRYQRLDVTKREGETLVTVRVAFDFRHMVRHHHSVEANLFIHAHRFKHIDVAVIDERFLEIEKPSTDVSEMHIEDLPRRAKIADHIKDLFTGIF